jgi:hypothetical protein
MTYFRITFETISDAFKGDNSIGEVLRLMNVIHRSIKAGDDRGSVHDSNGKRIGSWEMNLPNENS